MTYSEKHITAFKDDLSKIRARPSMYIGPTNEDGIFSLLRECIDNSLDEAKAGRNQQVNVHIIDRTHFVVSDNGVGIPVKVHPVAKISTLTHVLTSLQSSGKMTAEAYQNAVGVHGVGIKAVTALSEKLQVWTFRDSNWYTTSFAQGKQVQPVKKCAAPKIVENIKRGTVFEFRTDKEIFGKSMLNVTKFLAWLNVSSFLNPNVRIRCMVGDRLHEYHSKNGIADYLTFKLQKKPTLAKPITLSTASYDLGIAFTDEQDFGVDFFTNTVANVDGGFHEDTLLKALMDSLKPFMGRTKFTAAALKAGMVGIFNVRMNSPKFSSQTKEKLVDERAKKPLYDSLIKDLAAVWKGNNSLAKTICKRASEFAQATLDFRQSAKAMRALKQTSKKALLPGKLTTANCKPEEREIFIVEGDSAAGTSKAARFPHQEILALKGKIINAAKEKPQTVLANESALDMLKAIGYNPSLRDPMSAIRVKRVIILSDADVDGRHIDALQLTLWYKFVPALFEQGRIFIVKSYEFVARNGKTAIFADSLEQMREKCGGNLPKDVTQLKGLGEMSAADLRDMAFNKDTRKMWRITKPDAKGQRMFNLIMGEDVEFRRKMLGV